MTETNQTATEETKPEGHLLTLMIDLSNPMFARRDLLSRFALASIMDGIARAVVRGAEATIVDDAEHKPVGVYMIAQDVDGEGRKAFAACVDAVNATMTEVGAETVGVAVNKG